MTEMFFAYSVGQSFNSTHWLITHYVPGTGPGPRETKMTKTLPCSEATFDFLVVLADLPLWLWFLSCIRALRFWEYDMENNLEFSGRTVEYKMMVFLRKYSTATKLLRRCLPTIRTSKGCGVCCGRWGFGSPTLMIWLNYLYSLSNYWSVPFSFLG